MESEVSADEKIISEKEYNKKSGLAFYQKKFGHGGARENAGRKQKFALPLKFQIRVTKEEKDFIAYAREHKLNCNKKKRRGSRRLAVSPQVLVRNLYYAKGFSVAYNVPAGWL